MIETKNKTRLKGKITYTYGREKTLEYGAEHIERAEYEGRDDIASIVLPNSLESIGYEAFAECAELRSVVLQNGVTSIDHYAFRDCPKLESVKLSDNLENIGAGIFLKCTALAEVFIPEKARFNKEQPFQGCECIVSIHPKNPYYKVIDGSIYSVDEKTLVSYIPKRDIKSFSVPPGTEKIGEYAFSRCGSIEEITLPGSVRFIGDSAFQGCEALESLTIPDGVEEISPALFYACQNLKRVYIPASMKAVGFAAFEKCGALSEICFAGKKSEWKRIMCPCIL